MERRLLRGIMNPAMIATLSVWAACWPGRRASSIGTGLDLGKARRWSSRSLIYHMRSRVGGRHLPPTGNRHSARFFRIVNELPTLALIAIVILVVVKPF